MNDCSKFRMNYNYVCVHAVDFSYVGVFSTKSTAEVFHWDSVWNTRLLSSKND